MKRWTTGLSAAVLLVVAPAFPAAADTPTMLELVSGGGAAVGAADPATEISLDGETWIAATVVQPHFFYSTIDGTGWVSDAGSGLSRQFRTTQFRRTFELPAGATGAVLELCVHADNAVSITLNGTPIGAQVDGPLFPNFQDPAECYAGVPAAGSNVLEFVVSNHDGPMGLDYRAEVTYSDRVDTPPVLDLPGDLTVNATSPAGAPVTFEATATDDTGATVSCTPDSGATFAIGTTTVECTATDEAGATVSGSFLVTVRGAREQLADLLVDVTGVGPGSTLAAKIRNVVASLPDRALPVTCEPLRAFVQAVRAQSGRSIPADRAAAFIEDATRIRAVLGCR